MITIDGVSKSYHNKNKSVKALNEISLHIPKGEIVGVLGISGSGKTTLFKIIAGILKADSGNISVVCENPILKRKLMLKMLYFLSSTHSSMDENESIRTNFTLLCEVYECDKKKFWKDYDKYISLFDLISVENKKVSDLSLGLRRRAELIMAFIINPLILLLDEPTIGLDENAKEIFRMILKDKKNEGRTILISSHQMDDIELMCSRILILEDGSIRYYGNSLGLLKTFKPINKMIVRYKGQIPELSDILYESCEIENDILTISYNTKYITAAEIINVIRKKALILDMKIKKPNLESVVIELQKMGEKEWMV